MAKVQNEEVFCCEGCGRDTSHISKLCSRCRLDEPKSPWKNQVYQTIDGRDDRHRKVK